MTFKLKPLLAAALLALSLPALAADNGKPAPAFEAKTAGGKTVKLADYKGKIVVLEWVNEGCPFVHKHYDSGNMQALQKKYTARGVVWLSVASSAPGKQGYWADGAPALAFKKERAAHMSEILLDPAGTLGQAYGAKNTPHMFVIDAKGRLTYQGAIDSIASTDTKDIAKATNWVAQALDELLAGKPVSVGRTRPYGCGVKYAD